MSDWMKEPYGIPHKNGMLSSKPNMLGNKEKANETL